MSTLNPADVVDHVGEIQSPSTKFFAKLSCDLNSSSGWPAELREPRGCYTRFWKWWERLALRFIRTRVNEEIRHNACIAAMDVCDLVVGLKEVLRYWNTTDPRNGLMTNAEFEAWWDHQYPNALPARAPDPVGARD